MNNQMFANTLSRVTNAIRMLGVRLQNNPLTAISLSNVTRFGGRKKMYQALRRNLEKYFWAAKTLKERNPLVAYQLRTRKAVGLVENFLERSPGGTWVS